MMTDSDLMPFGKYKNEKMANVPAGYLLWLYDNNKCTKEVKEYIEDNMDVLKQEQKQGMYIMTNFLKNGN